MQRADRLRGRNYRKARKLHAPWWAGALNAELSALRVVCESAAARFARLDRAVTKAERSTPILHNGRKPRR